MIQNYRRRVCHAGNAQHAKAAVPRGNHFGNRGHADEVRTDRAQVANFRGRFVAWTEESRVYALIHPNAEAVCFANSHFAKALVVVRSHVLEAQAESLDGWAGQRIDSLHTDAIA